MAVPSRRSLRAGSSTWSSAVTATTVAITDPRRRRVVMVDRSSGASASAVTALPIGPPVAGAHLPHTFSPVVADGDDVLVGCDGDGSIRRLTPRA